jgi:hypothetical protein
LEEYFCEFEQLDEDIDYLGDDNKYPYVSRQDYEASLMKESKSEDIVITEILSAHGDKNSASSKQKKVIHGIRLIPQHCKSVKKLYK